MDTIDLALEASGCDRPTVGTGRGCSATTARPKIAGGLANLLDDQGMLHVPGALNHPQGKIKRWHQTLKNRILLENDYLPGALEAAISDDVEHYNHGR